MKATNDRPFTVIARTPAFFITKTASAKTLKKAKAIALNIAENTLTHNEIVIFDCDKNVLGGLYLDEDGWKNL